MDFASPDVHYLSSITVSSGKVFAMFVKSPARVSAREQAVLPMVCTLSSSSSSSSALCCPAERSGSCHHPCMHLPFPRRLCHRKLHVAHTPQALPAAAHMSPAQMYTESESDLRRIRSTFKTV